MNQKIAKLLKGKAKQFARERGYADHEFAYKELKKLWNRTPAICKGILGL